MKIGLFGGSFDPVHVGHAAAAEAALKFGLDKLIIIPTGNMPHKTGCRASGRERIDMLHLAFVGEKFIISDYEVNRSDTSYSADTIEHFKKLFPGDEIYFIIGGDSYAYIDKWHEPERIFQNAVVLVYPRGNEKILPPAVRLDCDKVQVSSTEIREKIERGENVSDLLKKEVYEYITDNGLYR